MNLYLVTKDIMINEKFDYSDISLSTMIFHKDATGDMQFDFRSRFSEQTIYNTNIAYSFFFKAMIFCNVSNLQHANLTKLDI